MLNKKNDYNKIIDEICNKEFERYNELLKKCEDKNDIFMMFTDALHNFGYQASKENNALLSDPEEFFRQLREIFVMMRLFTSYGDKGFRYKITQEEKEKIMNFLDKDFRNLTEKFKLIDNDKLSEFGRFVTKIRLK